MVSVSRVQTGAAPTASVGAGLRSVSLSQGSGLTLQTGAAGLSSRLPSLALPSLLSNRTGAAPAAYSAPVAARGIDAEAQGLKIIAASDGASPETVSRKLDSPARTEIGLPVRDARKRSVFARLGNAFKLGRVDTVFDGNRRMHGGHGILPEEPGVPDIDLDPVPQQPGSSEIPGISWDRVHIPGATTEDYTRSGAARALTLPGSPRTAAEVEAALRDHIARNPGDFAGLSPRFLTTVISHKVEGRMGLSDMVYISMRQQHQGLSVEGSYLTFTVRLVEGRAVLAASSAQLYPTMAVESEGGLDEMEALEAAFERLGRPTNSLDDMRPLGRRVMHLGGQWRAVALFHSESKQFVAAVDVRTGEAFAWNARMHAEAEGEVSGRGVAHGPQETDTTLTEMAMSHTELTTSDGRKFFTDKDGYFTLEEGEAEGPVTVTARLKGKYASVEDRRAANLTVTTTIKPGEKMRLVFNPVGAEENTVAQVNAYRHVNVVHDWLVSKGIDINGIHKSIPVRTNDSRDCNAYYTPWSPSLNFFSSSKRCANTSFDSVVYHEYGHFVDDMIGGIVNGGLSEGWGDIFSMFITGAPAIGEGFLRERTPSYIRHGDNKYQYKSRDEVHAQGQAWMGFAWKLRKSLIASMEAAGVATEQAAKDGQALAEALIVPVIFANVRDIPKAIEAVLLRDVDETGRAKHFKEIDAAAKAHGIVLKEPTPGAANNTLVRRAGFGPWMAQLIARMVQRLRV